MSSQTETTTIAVVYNPVRIDVPKVQTALENAVSALPSTELLWLATTAEDPGFGQTKQALEAGASVVIAAGGDGTVRPVAETVRDTTTALGIIPTGTGNLLARNLNLPLNDVDAACEVALNGVTRSIDVGVTTLWRENDEQSTNDFLVIAGIGIDAHMIANTNPDLKRRVGWIAYVDAGLRSLKRARKIHARFSVDDGPWRSAHVSSLLFANCALLPANIELIPNSAVDDGLLDIVVLQPASFLGWLAIWRAVTWENRVLRKSSLGRRIVRLNDKSRRTHMNYLRGSHVRVHLERPEPFQLDGDSCGDVTRLEIRVDAGGLRVRVPAEFEENSSEN